MMKKNRSSIEFAISDYFFVVYPLSIQFEREYNSKFNIYFEKNLQIITKHQTPTQTIKKGEVIHFACPSSVHHFRIQSEKNLDYQWSLYMHHVDQDGENEEFIEGLKVSLKSQWANYILKRDSHQEIHAIFSTNIRCKFNYLVIIANSNRQAFETLQRFFNQKTSILTNIEVETGTPEKKRLSETSVKSEPKQSEKGIVSSIKIQEKLKNPNNQHFEKKEEATVSDIKLKSEKMEEQIEVSAGFIYTPEGENVENTSSPNKDQDRSSIQRNSLAPHEANMKLSVSQLELGNEIEEEVNKFESQKGDRRNKPIMILQEEPAELEEEKDLSKEKDKKITMTSSQLLNEKGQVILPFYKKPKVIALIFLIIFIIAGGLFAIRKTSQQNIDEELKKNKNKVKDRQKGKQKEAKGEEKKLGNKKKK